MGFTGARDGSCYKHVGGCAAAVLQRSLFTSKREHYVLFSDGQRPLIFKSFPTIDKRLPCLSVCVEWNQKAISIVRVKLSHRANLAVLWMTVKCPRVVEVYQCSRSNKTIKPRERLQRRGVIININRHECGRKRSQLFD